MVVWIASFPRSGNTLLRVILNHVYAGVRTYEYYPIPDDEAWRQSFGRLTGAAGGALSSEDLARLDAAPEVTFVKTHELPLDDRYPAIYAVRDGRDALVSLAHYIQEYRLGPERSFAEVLRDAIISRDQFGGWTGNVHTWWQEAILRRVAFVRFEDLVADPIPVVAGALERLGMELERGTAEIPTFEALRQVEPRFFRRGKVGGWRDEMPPELQAIFWQHHRAMMYKLGYPDDTLADRRAG
jgi:hypothetical protein